MGWKVLVADDSLAAVVNYHDAAWKNVTLPYAWNEDDAFKKDIAELSTGIAWYRKHFKVSGKNWMMEWPGIIKMQKEY